MEKETKTLVKPPKSKCRCSYYGLLAIGFPESSLLHNKNCPARKEGKALLSAAYSKI